MQAKYIIFAHGIHSGGGWTLLESLWQWIEDNDAELILDLRSKRNVPECIQQNCHFYQHNFLGRLKAEMALKRLYRKNMKVLSFNSIPFIIFRPKKYFLFFQNVEILSPVDALIFSKRNIKKFLLRFFYSNNIFFIVQTDSVRRRLENFFSNRSLSIIVKPFLDLSAIKGSASFSQAFDKKKSNGGYIYPADGSPHKNHRKLIFAWIHLQSRFSHRPKLYLTLDTQYETLWKWISNQVKRYDLDIYNIGSLSREELLKMISKSDALIYPSIHESFGLPLIEAQHLNVDIIASERDYVRDVCFPNETFSPLSHISIARAILRYESRPDLGITQIIDGTSFMNSIFKN